MERVVSKEIFLRKFDMFRIPSSSRPGYNIAQQTGM